MNLPAQKPVEFQLVIDALLNQEEPFPAKFLHRFSDIDTKDLEQLKAIWLQIPTARRIALMEDLEYTLESDILMSFNDLAEFVLFDPEALVRGHALHMLAEEQPVRLVQRFLILLNVDPEPYVRAQAAATLAQYVLRGELEEIPSEIHHEVEDHLLLAAGPNEEELVRQKAIEALGFSSRPEVKPLIQAAYETDDSEWLQSALYAMGASADSAWQPEVMQMIDHPDPDVQEEAIRAAGNLELSAARPVLIEMLAEEIEDSRIRQAVIWSLSQIGGKGVQEILTELMDQTEDEEEADFIEEAMGNLVINEDFDRVGMFDFAEQGREEDYDYLADVDLSDEEDSDTSGS